VLLFTLTLIEVQWKTILALSFHEKWEVDVALFKGSRVSSVVVRHKAFGTTFVVTLAR
jgi:hypothetical protein